jgi:hypothetical protein
MQQIEVIKTSRLNGKDVMPGEIVEIEDSLFSAWVKAGRARAVRKGPGRPPKVQENKPIDISTMSKKKLLALAEAGGVEIEDPKKITLDELRDLIIAKGEENDAGEGKTEARDESGNEKGAGEGETEA